MRAVLLLVACVALAAVGARGEAEELTVLQPTSLANQFPNGIDERPALFGIPQFGASMTGLVFYATPGTDGCSPMPSPPSASDIYIYLVDRGNCTFVQKVRHAEQAGARAVIVVDNVAESFIPYMADDGTGSTIQIPSVLIHKVDGQKIKDTLANEDVLVHLEWTLPAGHEWQIWTSSNIRDPTFRDFVHNFRDVAYALGSAVSMTPYYYVIDGSSRCMSASQPCGSQCIMQGRYCASDPELDLSRGLDGADVVLENLRQSCIFKVLNESGNPLLWWDYVIAFEDTCAHDPANDWPNCSQREMQKLRISTTAVQRCIDDAGGTTGSGTNQVLEASVARFRQDNVIIIPTISINNVAYRGSPYCPKPIEQSTCGVFQALCTTFDNDQDSLPRACTPGCPLEDPDCNKPKGGVSVGAVVGIVVSAVLVAGLVTFMLVKRQQRQMRRDLDSILASYMPIDEHQQQQRQRESRQPLVSAPTMDSGGTGDEDDM